mmetsp:Transcript_63945/g.140188  ORF Transcript_63945/g.140188 Transcript_63945/m.140188 type:complete len:222 (+) Transcript_63945:1068-1733(+)
MHTLQNFRCNTRIRNATSNVKTAVKPMSPIQKICSMAGQDSSDTILSAYMPRRLPVREPKNCNSKAIQRTWTQRREVTRTSKRLDCNHARSCCRYLHPARSLSDECFSATDFISSSFIWAITSWMWFAKVSSTADEWSCSCSFSKTSLALTSLIDPRPEKADDIEELPMEEMRDTELCIDLELRIDLVDLMAERCAAMAAKGEGVGPFKLIKLCKLSSGCN